MKSYIKTAALITGCGSAAFWFPGIKPGTNETGQNNRAIQPAPTDEHLEFLGSWTDGRGVTPCCQSGSDFSNDDLRSNVRFESKADISRRVRHRA